MVVLLILEDRWEGQQCVCVGKHVGIRKLGSVTILPEMAPARSNLPPSLFLHSSMPATERPSVYSYKHTHSPVREAVSHTVGQSVSLSASHLQRLGLIHMTVKWSCEQTHKN